MMQNFKHVVITGSGVTGLSYLRFLLSRPWESIQLVDKNLDYATKVCAWFKEHLPPEKQHKFEIVPALSPDMMTKETTLMISPGWRTTAPDNAHILQALDDCGGHYCTDMDLLFAACAPYDLSIVGVTGTNGKTTTASLLAHVCQAAGRKVMLGGNIGVGVLDFIPHLATLEILIIEISSFQLMQMKTGGFTHGIFLNFTPDHLDYHVSLAEYFNAKARIADATNVYLPSADHGEKPLAPQSNEQSNQQSWMAGLCQQRAHKPNLSTVGEAPTDTLQMIHHAPEKSIAYVAAQGTVILEQETIRRINHVDNGAFVAAVAMDLGIPPKAIQDAMCTYESPPHRQQLVGACAGGTGRLTFINDSKATNVAAALEAVKNYPHIQWLIGGVFKEGILDLPTSILKTVSGVFCFGKDGPLLSDSLRHHFPDLPCQCVSTLGEAFHAALDAALAVSGEETAHEATILLSPLCASFDQFKNFEHRGQVFQELVQQYISDTV